MAAFNADESQRLVTGKQHVTRKLLTSSNLVGAASDELISVHRDASDGRWNRRRSVYIMSSEHGEVIRHWRREITRTPLNKKNPSAETESDFRSASEHFLSKYMSFMYCK